MKLPEFVCILWALLVNLSSGATLDDTPMSKVLQMLSDFQAKTISQGVESQKVYEEFAEFCEDRAKVLSFQIKTQKAELAELKASIDEQDSLANSLDEKLGDLSEETATAEGDLKKATEIRAKEAKDFAAEEKELKQIISALTRAIAILEREMQKGGASMLQVQNAASLAQALAIMVQASMFSTADASQLTGLIQNAQKSGDDETDASMEAPDAANYKGHSQGIIDTLQELKDKAEAQLDAARTTETNALHEFELLALGLKDQIKFGDVEIAKTKTGMATSGEKKSTAEGDLATTSTSLQADIQELAELHHDCMSKAEEFTAETNSRAEELKAIAAAKKVLQETTGGAEKISYDFQQVSLLQVAATSPESGAFKALRFVRNLAHKHKVPALALLAKRMASAVRASNGAGEDIFAKVKGLITDMIAKLEDEAAGDASKKAFCDKEMSETKEKQSDKNNAIQQLSIAIDEMEARSGQLREEVAELEKAIGQLIKAQAEMDKIRREEHTLFIAQKTDLDQGLEGVKSALKILSAYYAQDNKDHEAGEGTASGIIGLLQVVESDFSKELAEIVNAEQMAQAAYDSETKESAVVKASKEQDVKYKSKESTGLDKSMAEAKSDRSGVQEELSAVMDYLAKIERECVAKAESYSDRVAAREAEIAGLKEALETLSSETSLLQKSRRVLRGAFVHSHLNHRD